MPHPNELGAPQGAIQDSSAREFLRAWVVNGGLQVSLLPQAWPQPAFWGIVFADFLRHVAAAYERAEGRNVEQTISEIVALFLGEMESPTDEPKGNFE